MFDIDCYSDNQIITKWNWISQQKTKICLEQLFIRNAINDKYLIDYLYKSNKTWLLDLLYID